MRARVVAPEKGENRKLRTCVEKIIILLKSFFYNYYCNYNNIAGAIERF